MSGHLRHANGAILQQFQRFFQIGRLSRIRRHNIELAVVELIPIQRDIGVGMETGKDEARPASA